MLSRIWAVLGVLPQTLRPYIHAETGIAADARRALLGTMGLTELGLNIFFETRETIKLRRLACADPRLREALFPGAGEAVPSLFHYDPARFHIESISHPEGRELVFTALSTTRSVPMIRYATGDLGDIHSAAGLAALLDSLGMGGLCPSLLPPFGWVAGRQSRILIPAESLRMGQLRHGIDSDPEVALAVTGHFTIHGPQGEQRATVQLRRGVSESGSLRRATRQELFSACSIELPTGLHGYEAYPFGKDIDYEIKFCHSLPQTAIQPGIQPGPA